MTVPCSPNPCDVDSFYLKVLDVNPDLPNEFAGIVLPADQGVVLSASITFTNQTNEAQTIDAKNLVVDTPDAEYAPVSGFAAPCSSWDTSISIPKGQTVMLDVCYAIDEFVPGLTSLVWTRQGVEARRITFPAEKAPHASQSPTYVLPKPL